MKKLFAIVLLLAAFVPLAADNKPIQFTLGNWLWKPISDQALLTTSSPTFAGLTLSGSTASTLAYLNASKKFTSLANGAGYLLNDGSGGLSWAAVSLSGYLKADGSVPLTANWAMGAFELSQATWKGVSVGAGYGGTGQTSYAVGDLLYASGATALSKLAAVAIGQVLVSAGTTTAPAWSASPVLTSVLGVSGSGTDQAGTAININGGQSTGTGTPGSVILNVGTTSTTGSSANAYQTTPAMTIALDGITTHQAYLNDATGNEAAFTLSYQTNKSGSGDDRGLVVNMTDTASPGTSLLADFQTGGVSKFSVDNTGIATAVRYDSPLYDRKGTVVFQSREATTTFKAGYATVGNHFTFINYGGSAGEFTATSGTEKFVSITPYYNQASGTAANTDLLINRTETAIGSGTQRLLSAQVGSAEHFGVDNTGKVFIGDTTTDDQIQITSNAKGSASKTGNITTTGDLTADRTYQLTDYSGIFWTTGLRFNRPHLLASTAWSATIGKNDGDTNYVVGSSIGPITYREEQNKTNRSWKESATGLDISADDTTDDEGVEIYFADGVGETLGDGWLVTGTTGANFEVQFTIADVSATDQFLIGFRSCVAFDGANAYANYVEHIALGITATDGSVTASSRVPAIAGGAQQTDDSGVDLTDGTTHTLRVAINASTRVPTAYLDGVAITLTNCGGARTDATAMAPFITYMHGAEAADAGIIINRISIWR